MNSLPDIKEVKDKSIYKGCSAVRVYKMLPTAIKTEKKGNNFYIQLIGLDGQCVSSLPLKTIIHWVSKHYNKLLSSAILRSKMVFSLHYFIVIGIISRCQLHKV